MAMDSLLSTMHQLIGVPNGMERLLTAPTRSYVHDSEAMASTSEDIKEHPSSYVSIADMPGLKSSDITGFVEMCVDAPWKVQVEEENVLNISGERKEQKGRRGSEIHSHGRQSGKVHKEIHSLADCNLDSISAACQDGVLTVTVPKLPRRAEET